jgi:hypothetical protein
MAALILDPQKLETPSPDDLALTAWLAAPARGDIVERLRVYAGGYPARVQEALADTYPAIEHLVGDSEFANLAQRLADGVPLHSYNLNDAGAALAVFLRDDALTVRFPFLPDLARLEWSVACAFHAHDAGRLDPAPLAAWSLDTWEQARLRFQPWVAVVVSPWPIRELWECRDTPIAEIDVDLHDRPDRVLVRRAGDSVICESLDDAEAQALRGLIAGATLGTVIATVAKDGGAPAAVTHWFTRWMGMGLLTNCTLVTAAT